MQIVYKRDGDKFIEVYRRDTEDHDALVNAFSAYDTDRLECISDHYTIIFSGVSSVEYHVCRADIKPEVA